MGTVDAETMNDRQCAATLAQALPAEKLPLFETAVASFGVALP
jgi:hypothetical protein